MKTQDLVLIPARPQSRPVAEAWPRSFARLLTEGGRIALAVSGAVAVLLAACCAVSIPSVLPVGNALAWAAGFVFLALAIDADGERAERYLASGIALIGCALLAGMGVSGFLAPAGMLLAAWTAAWLYRA